MGLIKKILITVFIVYFLLHFGKNFVINLQKSNEPDIVLHEIYDSFKYAAMSAEHQSKPIKEWEWLNTDFDIAAYYILNKRILPNSTNFKECRQNSLDCASGFSYLDKDEYEHINYRRSSEYARSLFGIYNSLAALKLTGECKKGNKYSVCGILMIDINNNDSPNTMGYDVFKFAFYGDGKFLPYGIYWNKKDIENNCQEDSSGETCAAKIMLDGWTMKKGGDTPYFTYKK